MIEVLIYLCFIGILSLSAIPNIALNNKSIRARIILEEIHDLSKDLIAASRFARTPAQIIIKSIADAEIYLIFLHGNKTTHIIRLPKIDFTLSAFKTSSVFKEHIEIQPDGYVSPASITIKTSSRFLCSFYYSRFGNVRKACRNEN